MTCARRPTRQARGSRCIHRHQSKDAWPAPRMSRGPVRSVRRWRRNQSKSAAPPTSRCAYPPSALRTPQLASEVQLWGLPSHPLFGPFPHPIDMLQQTQACVLSLFEMKPFCFQRGCLVGIPDFMCRDRPNSRIALRRGASA